MARWVATKQPFEVNNPTTKAAEKRIWLTMGFYESGELSTSNESSQGCQKLSKGHGDDDVVVKTRALRVILWLSRPFLPTTLVQIFTQ